MSAKDELLTQAQEEFKAFKAAIRGLDERQLTEVWLGTWSTREILAHISGWQRELGPALERMARGEKPFPEGTNYNDVDSWNARFAAAKKNTTGSEALKELDASHEYFLAQAAKVSEERFVPGKTAHTLVNQITAHHYKEHGDQIRAWRQAKGL